MPRTRAGFIVPLMLLALYGCNSDSDSVGYSVVTLAISPSPATAQASGNASFPWSTSFTVTLSETGGVGLTISTITLKVQQASGGIVVTPTSDDVETYQYTTHSSTNRLESRATGSIGFDVVYNLPNGGRESLVTVSFYVSDDSGYSYTVSKQVQVQ